MSTNLGIAKVSVKVVSEAPNISKRAKKYSFDVGAYDWKTYENSPYFKPILTDHIAEEDGSFAVCFPDRRKFYVDNVLDSGTSSSPSTAPTRGVIKWKQLANPPDGLPLKIRDGSGTGSPDVFDSYVLLPLPLTLSSIPANYKGPIWNDNKIALEAYPNDMITIRDWVGVIGGIPAAPSIAPVPNELPSLSSIFQSSVRDGLWYAIESDSFLRENTPFWVNFRHMRSPSSSNHETCFIIRLGPSSSNNRYDIYLSLNKKPRIIDYGNVPSTTPTPSPTPPPATPPASSGSLLPNTEKEFDNDLARILSDSEDVEVGIMIIGGRLVVSVNGINMVYQRINTSTGDDGGGLDLCKIEEGKIQIFATNVQTKIVVNPMTFAPLSLMALPIPAIITGGGGPAVVVWRGCDKHGTPTGSVAELPTPLFPSSPTYGVDCKLFSGDAGTCSPTGAELQSKGEIKFLKGGSSAFSTRTETDFYFLAMIPSTSTAAGDTVCGINLPYGECPYFFRLKGVAEQSTVVGGLLTDFDRYLMSVDETSTAPDYFHIKKSATLTFYNPNNIIGMSVISNQTAIRIEWSWNNGVLNPTTPIRTFTGLVVSMSKSEVAGKETITLNCEDYIYILANTPIINSPFYDGMVGYYAVKDLAERAGCGLTINEWLNTEDYFLPSGFAFTAPKMRFKSHQMILECILDIVKRFEAYIYYDGDGTLHIAKLPGGLFSVAPGSAPSGNFVSDFNAISGNVILDERSVDINYESTVNHISIYTVDRNSRNAIIYGNIAPTDRLCFVKTLYIDQAALGELAVARAWATDLGARVYFPILKTRFKTVGVDSIVYPLDFVTVDGQMFRAMSIKRSFVAESNDMNCAYECEWLGGATGGP